MTNDNSTRKKWIVGIQQYAPPPPGQTMGTIVKLPDPGSGDIRDYAILSMMDSNGNDSGNDSYIAEFQSMSENFSSFIVGRHIVKDGDLYVINRMDPLFFYLATQSLDKEPQTQKQSWQPFDQFLEQSQLPREIVRFFSEEQIQHICLTFDNEELYFKFNVDKALKWLQKKQERVLKSLLRQDERRRKAREQRTNEAEADGRMGGSVSANFHFGGATPAVTASPVQGSSTATTTPPPTTASQPDTQSLKMESLQIVCNYLNQAWSKKFLEHLGHTMEEVVNTTTTSGTKSTSQSSSVVSPDVGKGRNGEDTEHESKAAAAAARQKAMAASRTAGNKRLAKVNTKGMRSIGSFFGAPKTKKTKR